MAKTKATIVLIEDDKTLSKTLAEELEDVGHEVKVAYDGEKGMKLVKKEKPDIVFLDINLPKKDGMKVLDFIRNDDDLFETPVVIMTVRDDRNTYFQGMDLGATHYIIKSHQTVSDVASKVESILKK